MRYSATPPSGSEVFNQQNIYVLFVEFFMMYVPYHAGRYLSRGLSKKFWFFWWAEHDNSNISRIVTGFSGWCHSRKYFVEKPHFCVVPNFFLDGGCWYTCNVERLREQHNVGRSRFRGRGNRSVASTPMTPQASVPSPFDERYLSAMEEALRAFYSPTRKVLAPYSLMSAEKKVASPRHPTPVNQRIVEVLRTACNTTEELIDLAQRVTVMPQEKRQEVLSVIAKEGWQVERAKKPRRQEWDALTFSVTDMMVVDVEVLLRAVVQQQKHIRRQVTQAPPGQEDLSVLLHGPRGGDHGER